MDLLSASIFSVLAIVLLNVLFFLTYKNRSCNEKLPPGRFGWLIISETLAWVMPNGTERFVVDRMKRYSPDVFKTSLLGQKVAVLCGPSANRLIFSNENKLVKPWIPHSVTKILLANFQGNDPAYEMKRRESFRMEFLKLGALQSYVNLMDVTVQQHLEKEWAPKESLKVEPLSQKLIFGLTCKLFLGIEDPGELARLADQFCLLKDGIFSISIDFPGTTFNIATKVAKRMSSHVEEIIRHQKHHLSDNKSLLSYVLSATDPDGNSFTEAEIASMILNLLFCTSDSTSSAIASIVFYLADHPHVYGQVLREQQEIAHAKGPDGFLKWEDTKRMRYSSNVINEVLRLAPPLPGVFREAIDDITYKGFVIPKGWKAFYYVDSTHSNPEYFKNLEKFDPMRFEENKPDPFIHTPFGGGQSMCLGREFARQLILIFLHDLIIRFKWENIDPNEKIIFIPYAKHPNRLPIKIQPLKNQKLADA